MLEFLLPLFHCFQMECPLIFFTIRCGVALFFSECSSHYLEKHSLYSLTVANVYFRKRCTCFHMLKDSHLKLNNCLINNVLWYTQGSPEDGGKPFQCPVCGLVIKRKSYWKRHMVIHTGLKSHQCPLCPFRCARKDNLKSHMKVS